MSMLIDGSAFRGGEWITPTAIAKWEQQFDRLERGRHFVAQRQVDAEVLAKLLDTARGYLELTGRHLDVYSDIGELYGQIHHGIRLQRRYAQGPDGRLGDAPVQIKTIAPQNRSLRVQVRLTGNCSRLLIVRIGKDFDIESHMVERRHLPDEGKGKSLRINWAQFRALPAAA